MSPILAPPSATGAKGPNELFTQSAQRRNEKPMEIYDQVRIAAKELSTPNL
jgi:hypothetical protein